MGNRLQFISVFIFVASQAGIAAAPEDYCTKIVRRFHQTTPAGGNIRPDVEPVFEGSDENFYKLKASVSEVDAKKTPVLTIEFAKVGTSDLSKKPSIVVRFSPEEKVHTLALHLDRNLEGNIRDQYQFREGINYLAAHSEDGDSYRIVLEEPSAIAALNDQLSLLMASLDEFQGELPHRDSDVEGLNLFNESFIPALDLEGGKELLRDLEENVQLQKKLKERFLDTDFGFAFFRKPEWKLEIVMKGREVMQNFGDHYYVYHYEVIFTKIAKGSGRF